MAPQQTRRFVLANPPEKLPVYEGENATFKIETVDLPELGQDQVLIKTQYVEHARMPLDCGKIANRSRLTLCFKGTSPTTPRSVDGSNPA